MSSFDAKVGGGGSGPASGSPAETTLFGALAGVALFGTTVMAFASAIPAESFAGGSLSGLARALHPVADNVATLAFGLSGAFSAARHLDSQGQEPRAKFAIILTAGILTGVGGGVLRDLLFIARMPSLLVHPAMWALAGIGALLGLLLAGQGGRCIEAAVDAVDFLSVGLTAVLGFAIARELAPGVAPASLASSAVLITAVTACGGGIVRDIVLLRRAPSAFVSPYLFLVVGTSLLHAWAQVLVGGDSHAFSWPLTAALVAVLGVATRNMRFIPLSAVR